LGDEITGGSSWDKTLFCEGKGKGWVKKFKKQAVER
jgi:hypothetical protein